MESRKKKTKTVYWSLKHWIYFTPVQALLLNSFFEISIYISCCTWSEVCMILAFPSHPFAYFRLFASISCELQLSTYRELTAQSKVQYIQPVYYSHLSTSQKFSIGLYFLQCWPVYSGHPASNNHLAICQEWPLYTGLTVCTVCVHWTLPCYTKIGTKNLLDSFQIEMFSSECIQLLCMSL